MFTGVKRKTRGGFTLLEITLAVAILAMMSLTIYRFVQANITALRLSTDANEEDARYAAFINLLTAQWQSLPSGIGALQGEPLKLANRSQDEITWICGAGPGLLTRYAPGDFFVSLRLRPMDKKSDRLALGLVRKPKGDANFSGERETWVPLMNDIESLQIRYYDPRLNSWVERWSDNIILPRLVKVVIGRGGSATPMEVEIPINRTSL
jgi:prepilin-type N-terminal cleavage/methylation domain-containing protein